jgi:hypothetical protein
MSKHKSLIANGLSVFLGFLIVKIDKIASIGQYSTAKTANHFFAQFAANQGVKCHLKPIEIAIFTKSRALNIGLFCTDCRRILRKYLVIYGHKNKKKKQVFHI